MKLPRMFRPARRQVTADPAVRDLLGRLRVAEKAEAEAARRAKEISDPAPGRTPEWEAAEKASAAAWLDAEDARHELDRHLHPRRYAARGFRDETLDKYRAIAAAEAEQTGTNPEPDTEEVSWGVYRNGEGRTELWPGGNWRDKVIVSETFADVRAEPEGGAGVDFRAGQEEPSPGSPEHYAAYKTNFLATDGARAPQPDDPEASYEIEYACELAHQAVAEAMYGQGEHQNANSRRAPESLGLAAGNPDKHSIGNPAPEADPEAEL